MSGDKKSDNGGGGDDVTKTTVDASFPTFSQGKKTSKWVLFDWWDDQIKLVKQNKKWGEKTRSRRKRKEDDGMGRVRKARKMV